MAIEQTGYQFVADGWQNLNTALDKINKNVASFIKGAAGLYLVSKAFGAVSNAVKSIGSEMVQGASDAQGLQIRFEGLYAAEIQQKQGIEDFAVALKMAVAPASELMNWINVLSVKTPFSRQQIANTMALGMAMGFTVDQAKTMTVAITNWASGLNLDDEAIQRILYNFGQMAAQGKLTGQELRDAARGGLIPVYDILRKMGEQLGLTGAKLEQFIKEPATSGASVNEFFKQFIELANTRFPNAAERMAKTWKGVTQNIHDFITTILGSSLIGPTLDKIAAGLAGILDKALSPEVRAWANVFGIQIYNSLEKVYKAITNVSKSVKDLGSAMGITAPSIQEVFAGMSVFADRISSGLNDATNAINNWLASAGKSFGDFASAALKWGANVATEFAIGIVQGAGTALVEAMNVIGDILAYFLGPGSPPRVAPNIDVWGKLAMQQFLDGMTQADFDILNDIQGPLKAALDALVSMGSLAEGQVGKIYAKISQDIIKAMEAMGTTGSISDSLLKEIAGAAGIFGTELAKLVKLQLQLLQATKAYAAAQKAVRDAQEADTAAKDKINQLVKEYRDMVKNGADPKALAQKRAEIKQALEQRKLTREQLATATEQEKKAEKALDPLKEQVKLQEALVNEMIDLNKAMNDLPKMKVSIDTAGLSTALEDWKKEFDDKHKGGLLGGSFGAQGEGLSTLQSDFATTFENIKKDISQKLDDALKPLREKWDKDVKPTLDRLSAAFESFSGKIAPIQAFFGDTTTAGNIAKIAGQIVGVSLALQLIGKIVGFVARPFVWLFSKITLVLGVVGTVLDTIVMLTAPIVVSIGLLIAAVGVLIYLIIKHWKLLKADFLGLVNVFKALGGWIKRHFEDFRKHSANWVKRAKKDIKEWVEDSKKNIKEWIETAGKNIARFFTKSIPAWIGTAKNKIKEWAEDAKKKIQDWVESIKKKISNYFDHFSVPIEKFKKKTIKVFNEIKDKIRDWIDTAAQKVRDFFTVKVGGWIETAKNKIKDWAEDAKAKVEDWVEIAKGKILNFFTVDIPGWVETAKSKIRDWAEDAKTKAQDWVETAKTKVLNFFTVDIPGWLSTAGMKINAWATQAGTDISTWIDTAITKAVTFFQVDVPTWLSTAGANILAWATQAGTDITSWVTTAVDKFIDFFTVKLPGWITDAGKAVADFAANFAKKVVEAILTAIKNIPGGILGAIKDAAGLGGGGSEPSTGAPDYQGPPHARGGLVTRRGFYELAEQGPELVLPAGITRALLGMRNANQQSVRGPVVAAPASYGRTTSLTKNYNLAVHTAKSSGSVKHDFTIMQTLG